MEILLMNETDLCTKWMTRNVKRGIYHSRKCNMCFKLMSSVNNRLHQIETIVYFMRGLVWCDVHVGGVIGWIEMFTICGQYVLLV